MSRTEYYVDPSLGSDTGDGTVTTPWGRAAGEVVQYALDQIGSGPGRNATDGDRINVKNGTDDVLTAKLTLATYGAPALGAPLVIQGYTSAAGDGGQGGISGGGTVSIFDDATYEAIQLVDMHLHNCGSAIIVNIDRYCTALQCEFDNTTGDGFKVSGTYSGTTAIGCNFHNIGGVALNNIRLCLYNYFKNGTNDFSHCMLVNAATFGPVFIGNIMSLDGASVGIQWTAPEATCMNNTILCSAGTGKGIYMSFTNNPSQTIMNNYVEGFSGAGGVGIEMAANTYERVAVGNNGFFNNTTNTSTYDGDEGAGFSLDLTGNDLSLGATGLAKSGSDTFATRLTYFAPASTIDDEGFPTVGG